MIGEKIGRYQIVRLIGKGGMGNVYEAFDSEIERRAAIKVLKAEFFGNADVAARFRNEARAVNIIKHSGLVSVFEFGELPDGSAYIVMEYLDGETLAQRMKRLGRIDDAIVIARQICSALCAAHAKRIVHRDLKPANIMLVVDPDMIGGERVKILDFGVAKLMENQGPGQPRTRTGMVMGSPGYMAPEQYRNLKSADERSDVYSLGVILFEMLAGRPPFIAPNDAELLAMHMYKEPDELKKLAPDVKPVVADFVMQMLRKQGKDRPTSDEVLRFLNQQSGLPLGTSMPHPIVAPGDKAATRAANADAVDKDGATHYPTDSVGVQPPIAAVAMPGPEAQPTKLALPGAPAEPPPTLLATEPPPTLLAAEPPPALRAAQPPPAIRTAEPPPTPAPVEGRAAPSRRPLYIAALLGVLFVASVIGVHQLRTRRAAPTLIYWDIISTPADAEVIRVADQQSLGKTPLHREQPRATGSEALLLRRAGHADRPFTINRNGNSSISLTLEPLPPPPVVTPPPAPPAPPEDKRPTRSKGKEHRRRHNKGKSSASTDK